MIEEIKPNAIYTTEETEKALRISNSTLKRLLKKGLIRANKIGGRYRILGREILRLVSPEVEETVATSYRNIKQGVIKKVSNW